jgi:DNA primase
LVGKGGGDRYYDKFRYRLMFPITDVVGRLVGFGGRLLPSAQDSSQVGGQPRILPKYLNSPDSVLYKKSSLLYGLSQAKEAIQRCDRVLLVEGYIDLLSVVQHGHDETVAVSGTALTADQLKLLRRFTHEIYIFFDGDEAGQQAATRAFPLCVEAELRGRAVFLPPGDDPDSFARVHGQPGLDRLIDQAEPLEDFYLARHMPPPRASAFQRAQAAKQAVAVLGPMTDILTRSALLTQIAQRFGVNEEELRRMATPPELPRRQPATRTEHHESSRVHWTAETELIQLMLVSRRAALRVAEEGIVAAFQEWGELATELIAAWQQAGRIDFGAFLDRLPKELADRVMRAYTGGPSEELEPEQERLLLDCIARIRAAQRKFKREQLQREIREAEQRGDEAGLRLRLQRLQVWDEDR